MKKLFLAVLFSGVALAGAKKDGDHFKALDKDADGFVSAEEAAGNTELTTAFATLDKDGDKKLSADEYKAFAHTEKKAEKAAK